ncbi:MAG: hypothetical protein NTX75_16690 [Proteobacteria bacterium]|nr:hypothetical protein [Pseudomonadota bacterium]
MRRIQVLLVSILLTGLIVTCMAGAGMVKKLISMSIPMRMEQNTAMNTATAITIPALIITKSN